MYAKRIAKYIHDSVLEECNIDILFVEPQRSSDDIDLLSKSLLEPVLELRKNSLTDYSKTLIFSLRIQ